MWITSTLLALMMLAHAHGRMYMDQKTPSDLKKDILKNYDSEVIPISGHEKTVPVSIAFVPVYIREMDEEKEILVIDGWLQMVWQDRNLSWNPALYNDIKSLNIPSDILWRPDITMYTTSPDTKLTPIVMTNVIVNYTGSVMWVPPMTVSSRCPMNLNRFPKDIQTCQLKLGSWTYGSKSIDLQLYSTEVKSDVFQDNNPEWSLKVATVDRESKIYPCCPDEEYVTANYNLTLKRRCSGVMYVADSVSAFAVVIGLFMFFLPADSAQKIVVGTLAEMMLGVVALYLAFAVKAPAAKFVTGIRMNEYMTLVAAFMLAELIVVNIARVGGACRPPRWLLSISRNFCQPFGVCFSGKDDKDGKTATTNKEEWYVVATSLDRLLLFVSLGVSVFFYKLR